MTLSFSLIVVAAIVLALVILTVRDRRARRRELLAARVGETFESFAATFAEHAVPESLLRATWTAFQAWAPSPGSFPVRASDRIEDVYGIWGTDHDELCLELVAAGGARRPTVREARRFGRVDRVSEVVEFVMYARAEYPAGWRRWDGQRVAAV